MIRLVSIRKRNSEKLENLIQKQNLSLGKLKHKTHTMLHTMASNVDYVVKSSYIILSK